MADMDDSDPGAAEDDGPPSKSALKRRMIALQALGERLVSLSDKQLARVPIDSERLLDVIREARGIRSHSARRRHLQLIGKIMRDIDPEPIAGALNGMDRQHQADADTFHRLEHLRDELLTAGAEGTERVTALWPRADRQQLRQLILQHQRETAAGKPPAASRKLFRYLRELQALYGDPD